MREQDHQTPCWLCLRIEVFHMRSLNEYQSFIWSFCIIWHVNDDEINTFLFKFVFNSYRFRRYFCCRCIPYRYDGAKLEVLVISSQRKGKGMLFPKVFPLFKATILPTWMIGNHLGGFMSIPLVFIKISLYLCIIGRMGNRWIHQRSSYPRNSWRSRS